MNDDPINTLLAAHGLRRTYAAKLVLGWFLAHPDTSYTHAQLLTALAEDQHEEMDRVTLYRLVDRLAQVGLVLCRVDINRTRRYQAMPPSVHAIPHFECQSCHQDLPMAEALRNRTQELDKAAQTALETLAALGFKGTSVDIAVRGVCADCSAGVKH